MIAAMNDLCTAIRASRGILLVTHCNPDGDGIGARAAAGEREVLALHVAGFFRFGVLN